MLRKEFDGVPRLRNLIDRLLRVVKFQTIALGLVAGLLAALLSHLDAVRRLRLQKRRADGWNSIDLAHRLSAASIS